MLNLQGRNLLVLLLNVLLDVVRQPVAVESFKESEGKFIAVFIQLGQNLRI